MKIAVGSDIHGSALFAKKFFDAARKLGAEEIILLGDLYYHGVRNPLPEGYAPLEVAALLNDNVDKLTVVKGNCDSDVDTLVSNFDFLQSSAVIIGDKKIVLEHGDKHDKDNLPKGNYCAYIYGHYHTGFIKKIGDKVVANAGSISLPKEGTPRSFIIIDDNSLLLYDLEGKLIQKEIL